MHELPIIVALFRDMSCHLKKRISVGNNRYVMKEISYNSSYSNMEKIKPTIDSSDHRYLFEEQNSKDKINGNIDKIYDSTASFVVVDGKVI